MSTHTAKLFESLLCQSINFEYGRLSQVASPRIPFRPVGFEVAEAKRRADEAEIMREAMRKAAEAAEAKRKADEAAEASRRANEAETKRKADELLANLEQKPDIPAASVPAPPVVAAPPPAAKANRPEQISQAQAELHRLGCFNGKFDGQLNESTRNAVEAWWLKHTGNRIVEINITDDFIKELRRQSKESCLPERPHIVSHPPRPKDTAAAPSRPTEPAPAASASKPPAVFAGSSHPAAPAAPAAKSQTPNATGIGF
jgi:hypothetical protein